MQCWWHECEMQVCASWCLLILWLGLFLTQNQAKNCGQKDLTVWDNKKKSEHLSNTILKKQLSPTPQHDYSIDTTAKGCPVFRLHQYTHYIKPGLASAKKKNILHGCRRPIPLAYRMHCYTTKNIPNLRVPSREEKNLTLFKDGLYHRYG